MTTKKAYGFRTFRALEIALYHTDPSLVTSIVKSYVPGVVGIPVISPFAAKLNPVGKGPEYFHRRGFLDEAATSDMLTWQGSGGFSVDASVRIGAED